MTLSAEQKQSVSNWVAAGDNLSTIQKKLREEFKVSMTYMDVRFLVDDLGLELKSAAPKVDASDVSKTPAPPAPVQAAPQDENLDEFPEEGVPAGGAEAPESDTTDGELSDETPAAGGNVTLELDRIVRPGTVVSGTVTFSDGVTGNWGLDQYGRLMLNASQDGYKPNQADIQAFQRELQLQLQKQGF